MTLQADCPPDFADYWAGVDEELARYEPAPELERLPLRCTEFCTVYAVRLTSVGPYRIFGYYSVPVGPGPFAGLLRMPGYGSVNHVPPYADRRRYVVLTLMHRGQRLADRPFAAAYPGLLTEGIDDPRSYVYRGIAADCLRGAEFLFARPEMDATRVGIVGGDLAVITSARRSHYAAVQTSGFQFYRLMEARERTDSYPTEEVNDYLRTFPERQSAVAQTVGFFDPLWHAPAVTARTMLPGYTTAASDGGIWLEPLARALAGPVDGYALTHQGARDHEQLDAWMARQLGIQERNEEMML